MKKTTLIIILLLTSVFSFAQTPHQQGSGAGQNTSQAGIIKGKIIDSATNQPVPFATVAIFSMRDSSLVTGTMTTEDGVFIIEKMNFGRYYLTADFIGYFKNTIDEIKVTPKQTVHDCGVIKLKQSDKDIEGVEIVGEASAIQYNIDRKVINVSKNINAAGGTLVDVLENTPSISVDIDGNVSMRGSTNFTVLIDGKPSVLDANDVLNQMPASQVESIEIITNPSAKYDPDGTSGIINIITKKKATNGMSGIINVSYGSNNIYSGDFLLNYKTKKINFFIGAEKGKRAHYGNGYFSRESYLNDTTHFLITESEMEHARNSQSAKIGFDYYLSDNTTVSLTGDIGEFEFFRNMSSFNNIYTMPSSFEKYTMADGIFGMSGPYHSGIFDLKHNFAHKKGHTLSATADFSSRSGGRINNNNETLVDSQGNKIGDGTYIKTFQDQSRKVWRLSSDYVLPFNADNKFEAGIQARLMNEGGDYLYEILDNETNTWISDPDYSNEMTFLRNIYSVYSTYTGKIFGFGFLAGLRGEYTDRLIDQHTVNTKYELQRFDYFPSFHISRELPHDQQVQASYSKRINRPRHWYLNPYPGYTDSYYYRVGNPELGPEYVDSYELSYQKNIKKTFITAELYYRNTRDEITQIQTLQDNNVMYMTFENLDNSTALGTELSVNTTITKWWKFFASGNFYRYTIKSDIDGIDINTKSTNYDFKMNSTFMLTKNARIQINGMYNAPSVTAQGRREGFVVFDAAYRHEFLDKKLSLVFRVRDPLSTAKFSTISEGENFYTVNEFISDSPIFNISLSYKINNFKQEKKRANRDEDSGEGEM